MPGERLGQDVRRVQRPFGAGAVKVVLQHGAVAGVGAFFNHHLGALLGGEAAQVGQALFGDDDLRVVLGVIDVRAHGHDAADLAALGHRRRDEERQIAVARKVAAAADAVHHAAAHQVGGVDVAVDVGLDHRVHGDHAQAAHQLGVVRYFLRAQDDAAAVEVQILFKILKRLGGERNRRGRGAAHLAGAQQIEHAVLQHLGKAQQLLERAVQQPGQHGIGDIAHAGLDGQHLLGQAAGLHLVRQKVDDGAGNQVGIGIGRVEHVVAVAAVRFHHGNHFGRIHLQVGLADAVVGVRHRDGHAPGRDGRAVVDVVHALHRAGQLGVHFQDHLVGNLQPGFVVANRRGGDEQAIGRYAQHLDHRHVHLAEEAKPGVLGDVRQVHVDEVDLARIDLLAGEGVGVERQALTNGVGLRQRPIALGRGGGPRPEVDLVGPALRVLGLGTLGYGLGQRLGIARAGKAAHANRGTVGDEGGCRSSVHDAVVKLWKTHALSDTHRSLQSKKSQAALKGGFYREKYYRC